MGFLGGDKHLLISQSLFKAALELLEWIVFIGED